MKRFDGRGRQSGKSMEQERQLVEKIRQEGTPSLEGNLGKIYKEIRDQQEEKPNILVKPFASQGDGRYGGDDRESSGPSFADRFFGIERPRNEKGQYLTASEIERMRKELAKVSVPTSQLSEMQQKALEAFSPVRRIWSEEQKEWIDISEVPYLISTVMKEEAKDAARNLGMSEQSKGWVYVSRTDTDQRKKALLSRRGYAYFPDRLVGWFSEIELAQLKRPLVTDKPSPEEQMQALQYQQQDALAQAMSQQAAKNKMTAIEIEKRMMEIPAPIFIDESAARPFSKLLDQEIMEGIARQAGLRGDPPPMAVPKPASKPVDVKESLGMKGRHIDFDD